MPIVAVNSPRSQRRYYQTRAERARLPQPTTCANNTIRNLRRCKTIWATRGSEDVFDRSIDVQVLRLRRKLETNPNAPRVILTERGVGYVFALPVEAL